MIFLGIGSNLSSSYGDRFYNIDLSISYLESYGILLVKKSSYYETPSYPDISKPKFINVVISVKTNLPPVDLMSVLIFIERKIERERKKKMIQGLVILIFLIIKGKLLVLNMKITNLQYHIKNYLLEILFYTRLKKYHQNGNTPKQMNL